MLRQQAQNHTSGQEERPSAVHLQASKSKGLEAILEELSAFSDEKMLDKIATDDQHSFLGVMQSDKTKVFYKNLKTQRRHATHPPEPRFLRENGRRGETTVSREDERKTER